MQNVDITNPLSLIRSVKLTANEKTCLANCDKKLKALTDLELQTRCPHQANAEGREAPLWDLICSTAEDFTNDPTPANFEKHLEVVARVDLLDKHRRGLTDLGNRAAVAARKPLALVINAIVDRAIAELDRQAETRKAAAESAGMLAEFSLQIGNTRAGLESQRPTENSNCGAWLCDHGFID